MADVPRKRSAFSKPDDYNSGAGFNASSPPPQDSLEPGNYPQDNFRGDSNIYIPPPPAEGSVPENVKVDLTTPLEAMWVIIAVIALIGAFYFYSEGNFGHYSKSSRTRFPPQPHLLTYIPYALFTAVASFLCWFFTDNYYIFNTRLRKILYHFKLFSIVNITEFLSAEQLYAIGVTGTRKHSKHRSWWEYKIVVIANDGTVTDFSNYTRDGRYELNGKARGMAAVMGCRFADCPSESVLKTYIENGRVQYVYFDSSVSLLGSANGLFTSSGRSGDVSPITAFIAIAVTLLVIFAAAYFTSR